ncbi:MAG: SDR family oxidoreductase [Bacteroidetes bacterium]|nr:SDR family oxidoreductase [Bacteroidota bacterium]MCL5738120.1 SDR family oxidoreductase [Bacteroidota bacterium]
MIDLSNQVVLITGGSRGIGAATAKLFAKAGANVAITYSSNDARASELVNEIQKLGRKARAFKGDNSKADVVKKIVEDTYKEFGRLDVLVNNAGIWTDGELESLSEKVWDETIDLNLKGTFLFCHYVAPIMKKQGGGRIINVSSTAGQRGEAFHSHYAASKGGVISFTKSLSTELAPYNILVNSVAPGWVDTEMCADVFSDKNYKEEVRRSIPLGRIPTGEDIAGPILFLASDLARHVTGEILNVNGGSVLVG